MSKFKVGDEVVRTHPSSKLVVGETYIIKEILSSIPAIILEGYSNMYNLDNFELAEIDYSIINTLEILTPLQAADAILHKEFLQEFCEDTENWHDFHCSLKYITLDMLTNTKFRYKPKTIVINGVEVPAPLPVGKAPDGVYHVSIDNKPYESYIGEIPEGRYFWATLEDAEKVRNAMLIPFNEFNELNKGER